MKRLIFLIIVGLLVISCSPCKRLTRKCPPQIIHETKDSIVVKDTIIYKDKEVPIYIPGDTQYVDISVPCNANISPIRLENKYALAKAWLENSKLKLELQTKDQVIKFRIDSAIQIAKHWEYKWHNEKQTIVLPPEKYIPKFYKFTFYFTLLIIIIAGVYLYLKIKTGALVKLKNKIFGGG